MATTNTLTNVIPQLLAQGLMALREQAVMPRLVNLAYDQQPGAKGSTIDVPIPSAITAVAITAAETPTAAGGLNPTKKTITVDQWYEAPFVLSDQEINQSMDGVIPMQASEAVKALANRVDKYILNLITTGVAQADTSGTPLTAPFASALTGFQGARKKLNQNAAGMDDRRMVLGPDAEANALALAAFRDISASGDPGPIVQGVLGQKFGSLWVMDQNVAQPNGTNATGTATLAGAHTAADTTLTIDGVANATGTLLPGDVLKFHGDTAYYRVTATNTAAGSSHVGVTVTPALAANKANNLTLTFYGAYERNVHFHRDAVAFASRPLSDGPGGPNPLMQAAVDPVSGLTLRLELSREWKQWRYSYDILYGAQLVRPTTAHLLYG